VSEASPPRVAVVDDDPTMRRLVTSILGGRGWRSSVFADAPSALEQLVRDMTHPTPERRPSALAVAQSLARVLRDQGDRDHKEETS